MATCFDISSFVESFWLKSSFVHRTNDVVLAYSFVLACYHCRCLARLEVVFVQLAFYCHIILSYSFKYEVVSKLLTPILFVKYGGNKLSETMDLKDMVYHKNSAG